MGLLDAKLGKIHYTKMKYRDSDRVHHAQSMVASIKSNNEGQKSILNSQYSSSVSQITSYYAGEISKVTEKLKGLNGAADQGEIRKYNALITELETKRDMELSELKRNKESTERSFAASQTPTETYWEQMKTSAEADVEMDKGMIQYFQNKYKEALANLFGGGGTSKTSAS